MPRWPSGSIMNLIEFSKILSDPSAITKGQTRGLDRILEEHPYFQAAHFLRLYALKKQRSFRYNDSIRKTAAFTTDRELLFNYITNFDFELHAAQVQDTEAEVLPDKPEEAVAAVSDSIVPGETGTQVAVTEENREDESGEELPLGRPLNFDKNETFSFGEWLQLSELKPIDRSADRDKERSAKGPKSRMELINDFLAKSPRIKPSESASYEDMAEESSTENEQLMTETLAHVYLEQKKYDKAIAAFTVLSLKYPEKSSFFADRIEAVRKLQNN